MKKQGRILLLCLLTAVCAFLSTVALLHGRGFVGDQMLYSFGFAAFCGFYWGYFRRISVKEMPKCCAVPAAVFAFFAVAGHLFLVEVPVNPPRQAVCFLGFFCVYYVLSHGLFYLLDRGRSWGRLLPEMLTARWGKHPFGYTFVLTCLLWAVPLVLKYPAGFCFDAYRELMQGLGNTPLEDANPVGHVMLLVAFYKLGLALNSANLGMFLFVVVQALILAAVVSYGVHFLVRLRAPQWCIGLALGFFWLSPFVTGYVGQVAKDAYFVTFFLLFVVLSAEFALLPEEFWKKKYRIVLLVAAAVGMAVSRNSVMLLLLPSAALMVILQLRRKQSRILCGVLLMMLLVPMAVNSALDAIFDPVEGSRKESLSFPFQQTARFVRDHPDLVTEEEKDIIRRILPYDELPALYDPYLSDMVKGSFNENSTPQDLRAYFGVWARQFLRAPGCYFAATMEQNVFLFYPGYNNYTYYFTSDQYGDEFHTPPAIKVWQDRYLALTEAMHQLPVVAIVNNMAVLLMVFLVLVIYTIFYRGGGYRHLAYLLPCIAVLVAILAGPCIRENMRYSLPILHSLPILIGCAAKEKKIPLTKPGNFTTM